MEGLVLDNAATGQRSFVLEAAGLYPGAFQSGGYRPLSTFKASNLPVTASMTAPSRSTMLMTSAMRSFWYLELTKNPDDRLPELLMDVLELARSASCCCSCNSCRRLDSESSCCDKSLICRSLVDVKNQPGSRNLQFRSEPPTSHCP